MGSIDIPDRGNSGLSRQAQFIMLFMLCLSLLAASGCDPERRAKYEEAQKMYLNSSEGQDRLKKAALLFEEAGDYKDAAKLSRECWYFYAKNKLTASEFDLKYLLASLREAHDVFQHISGYENAAREAQQIAPRIEALQQWLQMLDALDKRHYAEVITLIEAMDPEQAKKYTFRDAPKILKQARDNMAVFRPLTPFEEEYLDRVSKSTLLPDTKKSFYDNLEELFNTEFKGQREETAEVLATLRCHDVIAHGLNRWAYRGEKVKIPYASHTAVREIQERDGKKYRLGTPFDKETLILAMIKLAQAGDDSPEFSGLLTQLRGLGVDEHYARLLDVYNGGEEWVDALFPDHPDLKDSRTPGTVDYQVVHGPQAVKDALYRPELDYLISPFYKVLSFPEAEALFKDFVPAKPLETGYIYILDQGVLPEGYNSLPYVGGNLGYQGREGVAPLFFEPEEPKKTHSMDKGWVDLEGEDALVRVNFSRKGEYFRVANPDNARIAISEKYSYVFYGPYQMKDKDYTVNVFMPTVEIKVVDLVTRKTLFTDTVKANPKERYDVRPLGRDSVFIPFEFFDRHEYLKKKLHGLIE